MNFRDFGKYNQFKEQFAGMSPEMKEQMMRMAKEQMKARMTAFVQKWFSLPILTLVAIILGALVGALTAFFGQVLLAASALRDAHPVYWIPGLALAGVAIVLAYRKFGKGTERGMDMVFGVAHGKEDDCGCGPGQFPGGFPGAAPYGQMPQMGAPYGMGGYGQQPAGGQMFNRPEDDED